MANLQQQGKVWVDPTVWSGRRQLLPVVQLLVILVCEPPHTVQLSQSPHIPMRQE